jgi:hypothetical protein
MKHDKYKLVSIYLEYNFNSDNCYTTGPTLVELPARKYMDWFYAVSGQQGIWCLFNLKTFLFNFPFQNSEI